MERIRAIEDTAEVRAWRADNGTVFEFQLRRQPDEHKGVDQRPDLLLRCWPRGFPSRALQIGLTSAAATFPLADNLHFAALLQGDGAAAEFVVPNDTDAADRAAEAYAIRAAAHSAAPR